MQIVVAGNLTEGFIHYGPFEEFEDAVNFAMSLGLGSCTAYSILYLVAPEETYEGAVI